VLESLNNQKNLITIFVDQAGVSIKKQPW